MIDLEAGLDWLRPELIDVDYRVSHFKKKSNSFSPTLKGVNLICYKI